MPGKKKKTLLSSPEEFKSQLSWAQLSSSMQSLAEDLSELSGSVRDLASVESIKNDPATKRARHAVTNFENHFAKFLDATEVLMDLSSPESIKRERAQADWPSKFFRESIKKARKKSRM